MRGRGRKKKKKRRRRRSKRRNVEPANFDVISDQKIRQRFPYS